METRREKKPSRKRASALASAAMLAAVSCCATDAETPTYGFAACGAPVNIRVAPGTENQVAGVLPDGGMVQIKGVDEYGWYEVESGGVTGYVACQCIATGAAAEGMLHSKGWVEAKVAADGTNIRQEPGTDAGIASVAGGGDELMVLGSMGDWYHIRTADGIEGYVAAGCVVAYSVYKTAAPVRDSGGMDGLAADEAGDWTKSEDVSESVHMASDKEDGTGDTGTSGYSIHAGLAGWYQDGGWYDMDADTGFETEEADEDDWNDCIEGAELEEEPPDTAAGEDAQESAYAPTSDDVSLLGALIYHEAGNQDYEGKVAVGAVVVNRIKSSEFPGTLSEVVYQEGQFVPVKSGKLETIIAAGVPEECIKAAAEALAGADPTDGALYFNTGSGDGIRIGDHQFF